MSDDSDYCKKYFPHCQVTGVYSLGWVAECTRRGGRLNKCGCCMCNTFPTDTTEGGTVACPTCMNEVNICSGTVGTCPTGSCGRGRDCGANSGNCKDKCKSGCRCKKKITLCPIVRQF